MMLTPEQLAELCNLAQAAKCGGGASLDWLTADELAAEWPQEDADFVASLSPDVVLQILAHIDAQQARIAELEAESAVLLERIDKTLKEAVSFMNERNAHRDRVAELEQFVAKVAQQTPEKPDHWSACGQCERNASDAEDLIEAAKSRL